MTAAMGLRESFLEINGQKSTLFLSFMIMRRPGRTPGFCEFLKRNKVEPNIEYLLHMNSLLPSRLLGPLDKVDKCLLKWVC